MLTDGLPLTAHSRAIVGESTYPTSETFWWFCEA
jgi:hypothetical protein